MPRMVFLRVRFSYELLLISKCMRMDTCEEKRRLTITNLKKWGYLSPGSRYGGVHWTEGGNETSVGFYSTIDTDMRGSLKMNYWVIPHNEEKQTIEYVIRITTTQCNYGGVRQWFMCPLSYDGKPCMRRIARLYLSGKHFGCRTCHALAYKSQHRARSGFGGLLDILFGHDEIQKRIDKLRTKYWYGRPTKRHQTLLKRMNTDYNSLSRLNDEIDKLRKKFK